MGDRELRRALRLLLRDAKGAALATERAQSVREAHEVLAAAPDAWVELGDSELGSGVCRAIGLTAAAPSRVSLESLGALVEALRAPDDVAAREDDLATRLGRSAALRFALELGAIDADPSVSVRERSCTDEAPRELRAAPVVEVAAAELAAIDHALAEPVEVDGLEEGLARPAEGLLQAAVRLGAVAGEGELEELAAIVSHQLSEDVESLPASERGPLVEALLVEVDRLAKRDRKLVEALTASALEGLTLAALGDDEADVSAIDALSEAAVGGAVELVHRVSSMPPSQRRDAALRSIASVSDVSGLVRRRMGSLDPGATSALLEGLRHAAVGADTLELFRSALDAERPEARARALSWLHHQAQARDEVAACLRGDDPTLRLAALYLALRAEPEVGAALVVPWYEELDGVDLDTRRLATLAYVEVAGDDALPALRKAVRSTAFRKKAREARAAAIAGIGALGDAETLPLLRTLAKKRGSQDPVVVEAVLVVDAVDEGEPPYDVRELLERELARLGVREAVDASLPPEPVEQPPELEVPLPIGHMATMRSHPRPLDLTDPSSTNLRPPRRPRLDSNVGVPTEDFDEDVPKSEPTKPSVRALSKGFRAPKRVEGSERPSSLPPPPLGPEDPAPSPLLGKPDSELPANALLKKAPRAPTGESVPRTPAKAAAEALPGAAAPERARPASPLLKRVPKQDEPEEAPPADLDSLLRGYLDGDES